MWQILNQLNYRLTFKTYITSFTVLIKKDGKINKKQFFLGRALSGPITPIPPVQEFAELFTFRIFGHLPLIVLHLWKYLQQYLTWRFSIGERE